MSVEINIPPFLQPLADGVKQADVNGSTVGECLDELVERYPRLKARIFTRGGKIIKGLSIFVNSESAYPDALARLVKDGDKLYLAHLIYGG